MVRVLSSTDNGETTMWVNGHGDESWMVGKSVNTWRMA